MNCIYCGNPKTYLLGDGQRKCAKCRRKFSPKKKAKELEIINCFIGRLSATEAAEKTSMHFVTVKKRYDAVRRSITLYADAAYQDNSHKIEEFDEYLYLPKSIKNFDDNMHKVGHFITFSYDNRVYNIMMPAIERYHMDIENERDRKLLSKYLRFHKIAKLRKMENTITQFWTFFESNMKKYKGVSKEQFIYYLKEAEFRFNYSEEEQREILKI